MIAIMKWQLNKRTFILCRHRLISYCEEGCYHTGSVTLNEYQFKNLDDVIQSMEVLPYVIPLGGKVWLLARHILHSDGQWEEFKFSPSSWQKYINHIHPQIKSFLHHERTCDQRHARHGFRRKTRSRHSSSTSDWQQISSWPTTNVSGQNEQWTQSSTLPLRQDPDSGQYYSYRRPYDVSRNPPTNEDYLSEPEPYTFDIEEFGSVCSVEEPCGSA